MKRGTLKRILAASLVAAITVTSVGASELTVKAENVSTQIESTEVAQISTELEEMETAAGMEQEADSETSETSGDVRGTDAAAETETAEKAAGTEEQQMEETEETETKKTASDTEASETAEGIEEDEDLKAADSENLFVDGDLGDDTDDDLWAGNWNFGDNDDTWTVLGDNPIAYSEWAANGTSSGLGVSFYNVTDTATITMYQKFASLEAGSYTVTGYTKDTNNTDGTIQGYFESVSTTSENTHSIEKDNFTQFEFHFTVDEAKTDYKVGFLITASNGAWVCLDTLSLTKDASEEEQKAKAVSDLNDLITACEELNEADYTADSYAALRTALTSAKAVYDDAENKTLAEVKAAITALETAKKALVDASIVDTGADGIFVDKLNLSEDFIKGVDISSYISETDSGVIYHGWNGETLDGAGFFNLLKDSGINWVRIRVWNNPYDANGNGYGGGNNDIEKAAEMGELATAAGLKVLIDFHYSDFWADPAMQASPKAWENMTVDEKAAKVTEFTKSSLEYLHERDVDVRMVQIGNETNNGICGVSNTDSNGNADWSNSAKIFNAAAAGVRAYEDEAFGSDVTDGSEVMVAVHFTEPNTGIQKDIAKYLSDNQVDYDVFATSYYPFWHGTLDNLNKVLSNIAETYGKKVMVAETSYAYTYEDGDGHENNVRAGNAGSLDLNYNVSVQGQADSLSSIMETVSETTNGIGMFYWEPAWIPVQEYNADAADAEAVLVSNKQKWETYGSGWAASYSAEYDPENAGRYYGGSSWDNQALFDHSGNPLASLNVFKYVETGATTTVRPDVVKSCSVVFVKGEAYQMPETVTVVNNDGSTTEAEVTWNAEQVAALGEIGSCTITGTAAGLEAICNVEILPANSLVNGDFEAGLGEGNGWTINGDENGLIFIDTTNVKRGSKALKFDAYSNTINGVTISQTVTGLKSGIYACFMNVEGGGEEGSYTISINAKGENDAGTDTADLLGWLVWDKAEVTGIKVAEGGSVTVTIGITTTALETWGSIDDVFLYRVGDLESYAITYELNGGENNAENPASYNETEEIVLKDPVRSGYTFKGWYTDAAFTNAITTIPKGTTGAITLYAKWEKNAEEEVKAVKITLNKKKAGLVKGKTVTLKATVTPDNASNKAVTWSSSNTKVATVDSNGKVKALKLGKATITATAADGSGVSASCQITCGYKITYKLNKGTNNANNPSVYYKEKVTLKKPTRKGYTFQGWYTDKNFKKKITSISKSSKKNITVYAKWKKVTVGQASLAKVSSVSALSMKITVNKVSGAKGYKIMYSTDKNFKKNVKTVTTTKTSKTIKGLTKGKTYYVKVRAYKVDSTNSKVYGKYSAVKKVKIKK